MYSCFGKTIGWKLKLPSFCLIKSKFVNRHNSAFSDICLTVCPGCVLRKQIIYSHILLSNAGSRSQRKPNITRRIILTLKTCTNNSRRTWKASERTLSRSCRGNSQVLQFCNILVLLGLELKRVDTKSLKSYVITHIYTYKSFIYYRIYKVAFLSAG